jgi:hypothetical protein
LVGPLGSGGVDRFDYVRRRRIVQHVSSRLNDLLRRGLALEGAAAGSVLSGGLGNLIRDLQNGGQGDVADLAGTTRPQSGPPYALGGDTLETLPRRQTNVWSRTEAAAVTWPWRVVRPSSRFAAAQYRQLLSIA